MSNLYMGADRYRQAFLLQKKDGMYNTRYGQ
jgi:hypothetical protein